MCSGVSANDSACSMNSWPCNENQCQVLGTRSSDQISLGTDHDLSYWQIGEVASKWTLNGSPISYCQAKPEQEECKVQISLVIMLAVTLCNLVKAGSISILIWKHSTEPLITLGDAIASFTECPDKTTKGIHSVGKSWFECARDWTELPPNFNHRRKWKGHKYFWFRAASSTRWIYSNAL